MELDDVRILDVSQVRTCTTFEDSQDWIERADSGAMDV